MALESVLVPYDGHDEADAMLRFACEVVVGRRQVIVLYVVRVPPTLPLDPLPASFDAQGNAALDRAEAVAGQKGAAIETGLIRARQVADAIVGEAIAYGVDAIFMPLDWGRAPWRTLLLPRQVRAVMRYAPCPVLVGRQDALAYRPRWRLTDPGLRAAAATPIAQNRG